MTDAELAAMLAAGEGERVLNERRRYRDWPFDLRPLDGTNLADLDLSHFEKVNLLAAFSPDGY